MTKTLALLLDSYRELNSKRLFWIVLAMSAVVVVIFGALGIEREAVTLFGWRSPVHDPMLVFISVATFYKQKFVDWGIKFWLSWLGVILALVSTAGIFPDFIASGSVDLYLSKPISRLRLFGTKFVGGLLFVTLQVTLFCVAGFVLLRIRADVWEPGVFIAIPLVVLLFSYLFSVCVLIGVLTRSTIAALLLTLMFWVLVWAAQEAEVLLQLAKTFNQQQAARIDRQIAETEAELKDDHPEPPASEPASDHAQGGVGSILPGWLNKYFDGPKTQLESRLASLREERQRFPDGAYSSAHTILLVISTPLPKTTGTIELLEREMIKRTDFPPATTTENTNVDVSPPERSFDSNSRPRRGRRGGEPKARQVDALMRERSISWILGTSCAFEACVLGLAAWLFCRRDY